MVDMLALFPPLFFFFFFFIVNLEETIHITVFFFVPLAVDNCPNTPQRSPFPRIPVISPKKVSPSQNVYFSPLRSSKASKLCSEMV